MFALDRRQAGRDEVVHHLGLAVARDFAEAVGGCAGPYSGWSSVFELKWLTTTNSFLPRARTRRRATFVCPRTPSDRVPTGRS